MTGPVTGADRRAIFVDIDGTLVDPIGRVPASARAALTELRARGHLVFLCTGRSLSSIWADIVEVGWDGMVAAAGAYVEVDREVLRHITVPAEDVRRVVDFFSDNGVDFVLETASGVHASPGAPARMAASLARLAPDEEIRAQVLRSVASYITQLTAHSHRDTMFRDDVFKLSFMGSHLSSDQVLAGIGGGFDFVPASIEGQGGELSMAGVHKASGAEVLLAHLGMDVGQSIAFGDGWNDLEMLTYAGVGVAMGNAPEPVKAAADLIVARPELDGIEEGLTRLGLL